LVTTKYLRYMEKRNNHLLVGMTVFGAIFFIFGFATTFIVTLSAPVKAIFNLSEFAAQLLSSAFFLAYPLMSIGLFPGVPPDVHSNRKDH